MTLHAAVLDQVVVSHPLATGPDVVAVDGISWTIERGSSWAVVGRSGSGKSSLLAVLSLMRRPTSGRLELLGTDIGRSSRREIASLRARNVGVVFQAYHLDDRQPLWWNVALPWVFAGGSSPADARRRAEDLLDDRRLREEGWFDPTAVRARWRAHLQADADSTAALWFILMFQAWLGAEEGPLAG